MRLTSAPVLLTTLLPLLAFATIKVEPISESAIPMPVDISLHVTFPDNPVANLSTTSVPPDSRIILTNGVANKVNIQLTNQEKVPLGVRFLSGTLSNPDTDVILKNLTQALMGLQLQPGQHADLPYAVNLDMHPQIVQLRLNVAVTKDGEMLTVHAWKGEAVVVEQPMSLLDPQLLFLYLFLLSTIGLTGYWAYNKYQDSVNPRRRRTGGAPREPKVTTVKRETIMRAESPTTATATGVTGKYDESWIPEHHIKKQQGRSRTPKGDKARQ